MARLTREIWINAPKHEVWKALADFGNISAWNPSVPNSYLTSQQETGIGTTRHCDLSVSGASVEERVIEWKDGESMTIEIYAGKKTPPFKKAVATLQVREERGGTAVRGTLDYSLKMGPIGLLMDAVMVKPQFSKAWGLLFAGLKHYMETGEKAEQPKVLDLSQVQVVPA